MESRILIREEEKSKYDCLSNNECWMKILLITYSMISFFVMLGSFWRSCYWFDVKDGNTQVADIEAVMIGLTYFITFLNAAFFLKKFIMLFVLY